MPRDKKAETLIPYPPIHALHGRPFEEVYGKKTHIITSFATKTIMKDDMNHSEPHHRLSCSHNADSALFIVPNCTFPVGACARLPL